MSILKAENKTKVVRVNCAKVNSFRLDFRSVPRCLNRLLQKEQRIHPPTTHCILISTLVTWKFAAKTTGFGIVSSNDSDIVTFLNGGYKVWERWFVNRYKDAQKCENKTFGNYFQTNQNIFYQMQCYGTSIHVTSHRYSAHNGDAVILNLCKSITLLKSPLRV